ncbi:MAG: outer membrane protein assembly factor BamD [Betaproteobacteria bacterium]|nr:outer membrane protein assembly factor BamD [Betaproteobacteria bacterium]
MKRRFALVLLLSLAACGHLSKPIDKTRGWSAEKLYASAKHQMDIGNYSNAVGQFETLEARYPYGPYAEQAQLDIAYSYYKDDEPVSAVAAADRFIKTYPDNSHVDYAYYLKGIINFNQGHGFLATLGAEDFAQRDPKAAEASFDAFKALVTRFPNSKYTPDARARMIYLANALAMHDIYVAQYYIVRGAYLASVNRAQYVLQHFPHAPAREQALAIMVVAYGKMGLPTLQADTRRVLQLNFPHSRYLAGAPVIQTQPWWKFW